MTTKKATLKVHQLAKELNVSSKDIVARCKSEDIEGIENHLSPVSVGLALTIREWFGSGGGAVATATEEHVATEPESAPHAEAPRVAPAKSEAAAEPQKAHKKPKKTTETALPPAEASAAAPAPTPAAAHAAAGAPTTAEHHAAPASHPGTATAEHPAVPTSAHTTVQPVAPSRPVR